MNAKSLHAKIFRYWYAMDSDYSMPDTRCEYLTKWFWLIVSLFTVWIVLPFKLIRRKSWDVGNLTFLSFFFHVLGFCGWGIAKEHFKIQTSLFTYIIGAYVVAVIMLLALVVFTFTCNFLIDHVGEPLKEKWCDFRKRNCKKIEWKQ